MSKISSSSQRRPCLSKRVNKVLFSFLVVFPLGHFNLGLFPHEAHEKLTMSACRRLEEIWCNWVGEMDFLPSGVERKLQFCVKVLSELEAPMSSPWIALMRFTVLPASWRAGFERACPHFSDDLKDITSSLKSCRLHILRLQSMKYYHLKDGTLLCSCIGPFSPESHFQSWPVVEP